LALNFVLFMLQFNVLRASVLPSELCVLCNRTFCAIVRSAQIKPASCVPHVSCVPHASCVSHASCVPHVNCVSHVSGVPHVSCVPHVNCVSHVSCVPARMSAVYHKPAVCRMSARQWICQTVWASIIARWPQVWVLRLTCRGRCWFGRKRVCERRGEWCAH
jgi:hypothetical protein